MTKRKFPDNYDDSKGSSDANLPMILACGYRKIHIPKTGATFPVYLVSLPPDQPEGVWRSKRDFLLLGRANSSLQLPKAALKKLVDSSPWKRPSHDKIRDAQDESDNYNIRMKKSILQLDQFLQKISKCESDDGIQAWIRFCRQGDTAGLVPDEDRETSQTDLDWTDSKVTSAMKSSKLGQYFCSSENAKAVVNCIVEKCHPVLKNGSSVIFLEPSCGKGEIVKELVHQLISIDVPRNQVFILCFDIDNNAVNACEESLASCRYPAKFTCGNFLETKYEASNDSPTVFCLGGPPYTTGAGSHENIQRDLPTLFIRHCIQEYRARALCFLLPARYKNKLHIEGGYREQIIELKSSTFFFQGTIPVSQPSIIQCYEKTTER